MLRNACPISVGQQKNRSYDEVLAECLKAKERAKRFEKDLKDLKDTYTVSCANPL